MLTTHDFSAAVAEKKSQRRYFKFILIPGVVGFMLLCILMNVKFNMNSKLRSASDEEKSESEVNENVTTGSLDGKISKREKALAESNSDAVSHVLPAAAAAAACVEDVSNCALTCGNGSVSFFDQDLEYLQSTATCSSRELTLIFKDCEFLDGIMTSSFFIGDYRLTTLKIHNCNLRTIQTGAFQRNTVTNLKSLELINNTITMLQLETFEGLKALVNFKFLQQPLLADNFRGSQFLLPLASTLQNAHIMQRTALNDPVYPEQWLQGPNLTALITLDLSNNNLRDSLTGETFRSLVAVRTLLLQNCNLDAIDMAPFDPMQQLDVLYLDNNRLMTLTNMFMRQIQAKAIIMSASGNEWICDCEHKEMIDYLQEMESSPSFNVKDYVCAAPSGWREVNMLNVMLDCDTTTAEHEPSTTSPFTDISSDVTTDLTTTDLTTDLTTVVTTDLTTAMTTDSPLDLLDIQCFAGHSSETSVIVVKSKLVQFTIRTTSTTSVAITSTYFNGNLFIIYFHDSSHHYRNASQTLPFRWEINQLTVGGNYLFCMVVATGGNITVSPFDCQGHSMELTVKSWLLTEDMSWSIIVIIVFALHCALLGMVVIYFILRKRPTWLFSRSHRVLRQPNNAHKIMLLPRKSSRLSTVSRCRLESQSQENRVTYLVPERPQSDVSHPLYNSLHMAPSEMAPTISNIYLQLPLSPTTPRVNNSDYAGPENFSTPPEGVYIEAIDNLSNIYNDIASDYSVVGKQADLTSNGLSAKFINAIGAVECDCEDYYEEVTF